MKNDFNALEKILSGKLVLTKESNYLYITADISNPHEFIFIPDKPHILDTMVLTSKTLVVPGDDDIPRIEDCYVVDNVIFGKYSFTWVGDQDRGCWAYYPKI
jgi:hypothetical protein